MTLLVLYVVWKDDLQDPLLLPGNPILSTSGKNLLRCLQRYFMKYFAVFSLKRFTSPSMHLLRLFRLRITQNWYLS